MVSLQISAQSITYDGLGFKENAINDGSVSGSITATLVGDTYLSPLDTTTDVNLGNIPAGLSPSISVESGTTNWTSRSVPQANSWASVTYGNNLFVAVAALGTNRVMTSQDGITWTARTAAENNPWNSVTYANGQFVAVAGAGTHRVMTSPDGINWTARTAADASSWSSITYGNGQFVAVAGFGTKRIMTSPDGIVWTARTVPEANAWQSITYGNGLFVAVSINGTNRVMTSSDGITWAARAASEANSWFSVAFGNGLFVATSINGTNQVMSSVDGTNWTSRAAAEVSLWRAITYGDGQFVVIAFEGSQVMTSPDGINWTARAGAEANQWLAVTHGNGQFVAVSKSGSNRVMTASVNSIATLTLTGNANVHADANDVADVSFNFSDSAFNTSPASAITNATGPASSNLGIDFDDSPIVNLTISKQTGDETAGTTLILTVMASEPVRGDQTVDIVVSGLGVTGSDYTLSSTGITIIDGMTTGSVTFTILDDSEIEGTETATLAINNPSNGLMLGATTSQEIVIIDNDFPLVEISVSNNVGDEASNTVIALTVTATQAVTGDQNVNIYVSGEGISDTDYALSNSSIAILDGTTAGIATFTILSDREIEGSETATLSITAVSAGLSLGTTLSQDIIITDEKFDLDNDGIPNDEDNCPNTPNADQLDLDLDSLGDECDSDADGDGIPNKYEIDNGLDPLNALDGSADRDGDGFTNLTEYLLGSDPNMFDEDNDNNGIPDSVDLLRMRTIVLNILLPLLLDDVR